MQVNKFIKYLDHTEQLKTVTENEITPIIKEFPYCQSGQLMYAIQLNANNSILFEEQLKKAASFCTDRNKLFDHIHQIEKLDENEEKVQENKVFLEQKPVVDQNESIKNDARKKEKEPVVKEKFIPTEGQDELALLEKEYLTEAINSTILLETDIAQEPTPEVGESASEKEINLFDENDEHSFSSWLKHYNDEDFEQQETTKQVRNQDIIDRFIQEDPKIQPKKTAFYSPTNMARLSVTDNGLVSETLAIIHVDQGNFQEAINTYEKLMLKNPKKSSYFAAQIKILKQKIK